MRKTKTIFIVMTLFLAFIPGVISGDEQTNKTALCVHNNNNNNNNNNSNNNNNNTYDLLIITPERFLPAITADEDIDVRIRGGILNCKIRMRNYDDKTHTLQCYINATSGNYYKEFSIPAGEYWHYGVGYARSSFGNITATVIENGKILATRSGMIFFGVIVFTIV